MCKKTLKTRLNQTYYNMKSALENKLAQIEIVSPTADLWSKAKRSFCGMTIHWINPENLKRESAALACRRMKGRHT
ncbi:Putative AC9 transposase [Camponotus japonicus]